MQSLIQEFEKAQAKPKITQVRSGDTVRVQQKIREAGKERIQAFEGTTIRTRRMVSVTASITVRKLSSGIGVEKTFLLHSPNVVNVQVLKRSKVRRNYLTYLRKRVGKATRLTDVGFNKEAVNVKAEEKQAEAKADVKKEGPKKEPAQKIHKESEKTEPKAKKEEVKKVDTVAKAEAKPASKAKDKKAKAEAFRKAQEAKTKK